MCRSAGAVEIIALLRPAASRVFFKEASLSRATLLTLLLLCGCAASTESLQSASSGEIGCSPNDIAISEYKLNMYTSSWTAVCKDKTYYCSGSDTLKHRATCKQAQGR
jgi:hypothetical protein